MKIVRNVISVPAGVINGDIKLSEHVTENVNASWVYETYFIDWIANDKLLGIKRVINGSTIEINFIVSDAAVAEFKTWFDGDKETAFPGLSLFAVSTLIDDLTDTEIVNFYEDPTNEYSKVAFSVLLP